MHFDIGGKTGPRFPWLGQINVKTQNALHRPPGARHQKFWRKEFFYFLFFYLGLFFEMIHEPLSQKSARYQKFCSVL